MSTISYRHVQIDSESIFYRESGQKNKTTVLLLHGFPSSSHMYRNLIPILADKYHIVAPDLIGFGLSSKKKHTNFNYTFDNLARYIQKFVDKFNLNFFYIYVFDYGAPVGFRVALNKPTQILGIITQNGNAYEEGLSEAWNPIRKYWEDDSMLNRESLKNFLTRDATVWQYTHGINDTDLDKLPPDGYLFDQYFLEQEGSVDIQPDLFRDYISNIRLYPMFQEYFRTFQPPLLATWGSNDPFFLPIGAKSYKRDIPDAIIKLYDTGHFALETHLNAISSDIIHFIDIIEENRARKL